MFERFTDPARRAIVLAQVRRQKGAAIDPEEFERAAILHDQERQLLGRLAEREWRAGVDLEAVVGENQWLSSEVQRLLGEVQRLRELLRRHGVEPGGSDEQMA